MKELKNALIHNKITTLEAITILEKILNDYLEETDEEELFDYEKIKGINEEFYDRNIKLQHRLKKLNRAILLQELGIHFNQEELKTLLEN
ncbi:hypothetical protein [Aquimarina rhabdastrellae]